jgi:hypothetical protein
MKSCSNGSQWQIYTELGSCYRFVPVAEFGDGPDFSLALKDEQRLAYLRFRLGWDHNARQHHLRKTSLAISVSR